MGELIVSADMARSFPTLVAGLRKAQSILDSIRSFEDVERISLLGAGLSPNTYRSYLQAVKQLYAFTQGKHPLQITPGDIEAFYDDLVKRVDRNTAYLRVAGLKKFFAGIRNVLPIYTSPFETMSEKLQRKLSRTKKGNRTKKALNLEEVKAILAWLEKQGGVNYPAIFMLLTSGLRASELCQLRLRDLDLSENTWTARFTGKGDTAAEQELYAPAVDACRRYFRETWKREPRPDDALFWTTPSFPGDTIRPITYFCLWHRVHDLGRRLRRKAVLTTVQQVVGVV